MKTDLQPQAVLFDLDGTLADTAPDLAEALNRTLEHYGLPTLPFGTIRPVVSHGGIALVRLGFDMQPDAPGFEERRRYLLDVYADGLCRHTTLFPGMAEVLDHLASSTVPWGVVTNKPAWLTDPLMRAMGLDIIAGCIVSGDTCANRKPHPEPILHACSLIGSDPARTWYVGDAGRDMQAGRAAGCITIGARYGYLHPDDPPDAWLADVMIDEPQQLLALMRAPALAP
ncbi:MAG: HAD-IA family hydrolase [Chromatiaceae bacterium]|nr:HAD-IA family hydrolase [Chromatiaceae bacterium]